MNEEAVVVVEEDEDLDLLRLADDGCPHADDIVEDK